MLGLGHKRYRKDAFYDGEFSMESKRNLLPSFENCAVTKKRMLASDVCTGDDCLTCYNTQKPFFPSSTVHYDHGPNHMRFMVDVNNSLEAILQYGWESIFKHYSDLLPLLYPVSRGTRALIRHQLWLRNLTKSIIYSAPIITRHDAEESQAVDRKEKRPRRNPTGRSGRVKKNT